MKIKMSGGDKLVVEFPEGSLIEQVGDRIVITADEPFEKDKTIKSKDLHETILKIVSDKGGYANSVEIQEAVQNEFAVDANTVAWALVELQNRSLKRSKTPDFLGPIVKISDDVEHPRRYKLR